MVGNSQFLISSSGHAHNANSRQNLHCASGRHALGRDDDARQWQGLARQSCAHELHYLEALLPLVL